MTLQAVFTLLFVLATTTLCINLTDNQVKVGAIRWDAWNGANGGDGVSKYVLKDMAPEEFHWRLPWFAKVLGNDSIAFNGDTQSVMDKEIAYAAHAGLSFWAFDTYCKSPEDDDLPQCQLYKKLNSGYVASDPAYGLNLYLNSSLKHQINFCLMTLCAPAAHPRFRTRYLELFKEPTYVRVLDDRPLVFLFQVSEDAANEGWGGWPEWKAQWDALRNESVAQGTGNPYLVLCDFTVSSANSFRENLGFDAISTYALPGGSVSGLPFADEMHQTQQFLDDAVNASVSVVPQAPTGWDPRPRFEHPVPWVDEGNKHFNQTSSDSLAQFIADTARWTCNQPLAEAKAVLVYAWNENTEGGWLLPTLGEGTSRVDSLSRLLPVEC